MRKYCLTDVVQENLWRRTAVLHCGEDRHPQMVERRVHLTMGPTQSIHSGSTVFVSKLFERHARYIELHDVNGIGKERNWILFKIEDGHSSRGSFPGGHQFAGEPQAASPVRAEMQVDGKGLFQWNRAGRMGEAIGSVQSGYG